MEISFLKAFQHIEIVALDVKVLCGVEVYALLTAWAQGSIDGGIGSKDSLALVRPSKLVALFVAFYNFGRQQLAQLVKVNGAFYPPILSLTSVIHSGNNSAIRLILSCTPSAVCILSFSIFLKYFVFLLIQFFFHFHQSLVYLKSFPRLLLLQHLLFENVDAFLQLLALLVRHYCRMQVLCICVQ